MAVLGSINPLKMATTMSKLTLVQKEGTIKRMDEIPVYALPPWRKRVPVDCDIDRKFANGHSQQSKGILIATSFSEKGAPFGLPSDLLQMSQS